MKPPAARRSVQRCVECDFDLGEYSKLVDGGRVGELERSDCLVFLSRTSDAARDSSAGSVAREPRGFRATERRQVDRQRSPPVPHRSGPRRDEPAPSVDPDRRPVDRPLPTCSTPGGVVRRRSCLFTPLDSVSSARSSRRWRTIRSRREPIQVMARWREAEIPGTRPGHRIVRGNRFGTPHGRGAPRINSDLADLRGPQVKTSSRSDARAKPV
ncbi:hypothetical protein AWB76_06774 [Caballeronia temeraria]|uniref:Uncharacterized protein n=1 Tax=Caballeronia temeraria TaxID=1777137 RepID=A0A158DBZ4_9BURK|nr:hypothetical protein AWB76_06774 [Caballeronia temeraria]